MDCLRYGGKTSVCSSFFGGDVLGLLRFIIEVF